MSSGNMKLTIHTANIPEGTQKQKQSRFSTKKTRKKNSSFQERLLRNSCIACAVLLGILALSNVDRPWAQKASNSIEKALTMKIDLDQSIGQMSFVQKIMPESALVFFNLSGEASMQKPVDGRLSHTFSDVQPYLMFECAENSAVHMPADGIISAASQLSDGSWGILIDHGSGVESVIAGLVDISVANGDTVKQGELVGASSSKIYYEMREGDTAIDPSTKLAL